MKEKFIRFMQGRYGNDQLNKCLMKLFVVEMVVYFILGSFSKAMGNLMYFVSLITVVVIYYRLFSRNIYKRATENRVFLDKTANIRVKINNEKNMLAQRKQYHMYKCPTCKQKLRVPRGKGKISIHCPKCDTYFIKRS